ncbi:alpha/beta-hydrolase family protein [Xinfangfangia sp. CPCC 101601]|uniref:Alpha/beta-hydrolase family protein n=1 Tax=Pseudogemmobacter lacusdianii TaxID=3069608 RepID=A0ABU0W0F5_9RHOB|nr:alpha/beta-hydrolase family protein [Xinfangfangia sp. CPCC 101601]MDQ2067457.1 alpha/beta-hydrolase family protein [Xinfangfangia sp. CPCC 101601]
MISWREVRDHPLLGRPSALGLVLGSILFALSLTPSLIPRSGPMQGLLGGICFAIGYLIGASLVMLWDWMLERPARSERFVRQSLWVALGLGVVVAGWGLWNVTRWQNGIHSAMQIPPVESARPFTILCVAAGVAVGLIGIGRIFRRLWRMISAQLEGLLPRRLALVVGLGLAFLLFWSVGNDLVLRRVLGAMDETYAAVDKLIPPDRAAPSDPLKTGSAASLASWEGLGAEGRNWISSAPDGDEITAATGLAAVQPLRVYVGLNNAKTPEERAALALAEAKRVGAFDRRTLVIATPTGTGWMDPAGMQVLDYLTGGDVATIAVQYSYLPSWMSLFLQPEYGSETSEALFHAIYGHWRSLPIETRPRLFLFGLSLGSRNGEFAATSPMTLGDPVDGAFWVGPPFAATGWRQVVSGREAGSTAWAPRFGDGSILRSMTQKIDPVGEGAAWGAVRVVYLAYPSDPIAHFTTDTLWRRPDWLSGPRGPDVSPGLGWYPVVTFLQLALDMMTATSPPPGRGHVYAARDYLRGWEEVLGLKTPPETLARIDQALADQGL